MFCEIEPFCQRVLAKHWPGVPIVGDIRELDGTRYRGTWLLTGGFPCQPFSCAGKRKGKEDDRFLWPEMCRVIREAQPEWVLAENVPGLLSQDGGMVFERVLADLEDAGYETLPLVIPACGVGAPHRRDRVWIVAHKSGHGWRSWGYSQGSLLEGQQSAHQIKSGDRGASEIRGIASHVTPDNQRQAAYGSTSERNSAWSEPWLEAATRLCLVDDGLPGGLVRPKGWRVNALKGAGNAIVPQIAYEIIRAMKEQERIFL